MTDYSDIEIQTAKNLLKKGYKWIVRDTTFYGNAIYAYKEKPHKEACLWTGTVGCRMVCNDEVPIFQSIGTEDTEPTSIESIVHPQILDDAERRYLKAVIRPFRNEKLKIVKFSACDGSEEWLSFVNEKGSFYLPNFKTGTMYKGMELDHWYTLEELGL